MTIKTRLIALFLAFTIIPVVVIGAAIVSYTRRSAREQTLARLQVMVDVKARLLENYFVERKGDVQVVRRDYVFKEAVPVLERLLDDQQDPAFIEARSKLDYLLTELQTALGYDNVILVNPAGKVLYSLYPRGPGERPGDTYHDPDGRTMASGLADRYLSEVYADQEGGGNREIAVAAPVNGTGGEPLGMVVLTADLDPIFKEVGDTSELGQSGEMVLVKREGNAVKFLTPRRFQSEAGLEPTVPFRPGPAAFPAEEAVKGRTGAGDAEDYRGIPVLAAWRFIPSLNWGLIVKMEKAEVYAPVVRITKLMAGLALAALLVGAAMAYLLSRTITRPLEELERGAAIIGNGNFDHIIASQGRDEIAHLANAFDQMTTKLRSVTASRDELNTKIVECETVEEELRRSGSYNRSLLESSLDPLVTIAPDGKIADVNQATERATGRMRAELIGSDFSEYFTDPDQARAGYQKVFKDGTVKDYALEIRGADGGVTPVLYNASLYRDQAGQVAGIIAVARDVTELRRVEHEATRAKRALFTLSQVNQSLVRAQSEDELLAEACRILVEDGGYRLAWIGYKLDDARKTVKPMAQAGIEQGYLEKAAITWGDDDRGRGPTGQTIRSGKPVVCQNFLTDPCFLPWREEALKRGYASSLSLPLLEDGNIIGALMVYAAEPDAFGESELKLMMELADDVSYGISFHRTRLAHLRADEEARRQEALLRQVVSNAPIIIHSVDRNEIVTLSEGKGLMALQRSKDQSVAGKSLTELYPGNHEVVAANRRALAGESFHQDLHIGDTMLSSWFEPIKGPGGEVAGAIGVSTDVSDLRRATDALQKAHDQLEIKVRERTRELAHERDFISAILNTTGGIMVVLDRDGRVVRFNRGAEECFGYKCEEVHGRPFWEMFLIPEEKKEVMAEFRRLSAGNFPSTFENYWLTKNGDKRYITWSNSALTDGEGKVEHIISAGIDITERQRAEQALRESELRYRGLVELSPAPVVVHRDGVIMYANTAAAKIFGVPSAEGLKGRSAFEFIAPEYHGPIKDRVRVVQDEGRLVPPREVRLIRADGSDVFIEASAIRVPFQGQMATMVLYYDLTERRRAETVLRESEERFRSTLDHMIEGCQIIGHDWRYIYINDAAEAHNRRSRGELIGNRYMDVWPGIENSKLSSAIKRSLTERTIERMETEFEFPDGLKGWFEFIIQPVPEGVFIISMDISERRRIEGELKAYRGHLEELVETRTSEVRTALDDLRKENLERRRAEDKAEAERKRFNDVLETLPAYVVLLTADYHVRFANRVFRDLFGESQGRRCYEFLFNRTEPCEICETFTIFKTNAPHHWEWTGPNGRDYDIHDFPFTDADGSSLVLEMGIDITERKRAQEQINLRLRLSQLAETLGMEEFLRQSLDEVGDLTGSPIGFYHFVEPDQRTLTLQAWSTRTLRDFCRMEGRGRHYDLDQAGVWADCLRERRPLVHNDYPSLPNKRGLPPGHAEVARELVAPIFRGGKAVAIFGVGNKPQDYTDQDLEIVTRFADMVWDIIERKRAEEARDKAEQELEAQRTMAIRADRLRSLGEMAAGIAHELNQPLQGVRGLAEHITIGFDRGWKVSGDKIREKAELIMEQADRMTHVIEHVRTFARGADGLTEGPIQANDVIRSGLSIIGSQLKSRGIGLELALGEGLAPVLANPFSLEEVVINLINNARDALDQTMAQRAAGQSRIMVRTYQEGEAETVFVKIEVADNGPGIPEELKEKIFTPFFTTKPPAQGTGLGLAICRSIIEKYHGDITVDRGADGGAVVTVSLPAAGTGGIR